MPFTVEIERSHHPDVGDKTAWYVELADEYPHGEITVYPAKEGGIAKTFPHMQYNADLSEIRWWRTGKLCLDNPGFNIGRNKWQHEAHTQEDRLKWHVERTLHWVHAAANNTLLLPTDPIELPPLFRFLNGRVLGFHEDMNSFQIWSGREEQCGFAKIGHTDEHVSFVQEFQDGKKKMIFQLPWSETLASTTTTKEALWFRMPRLPILEPWHFPATWQDLIKITTTDNGETPLLDFLLSHAKDYRKQKENIILLIGFPLPDTLQSEATRMHWIAISNLKYVRKGTIVPGFPPTEPSWIRQDRLNFTSPLKNLVWLPSENWCSDQIKTRVLSSPELSTSKILLVGCGALGSSLAELLVRSGVTHITVMDDDRLAIGNLCRHTLDMRSITRYKSDELANKLNLIAPDVIAQSLHEDFPSFKNETNDLIRSHDVIIDCTAMDSVLHSFAEYNWQGEKTFISLSMRWKLDGLLAYSASETSFPVIDAVEKFRAAENPIADQESVVVREGLGCWNPVMPGDVENVFLAASIALKFIKQAISGRRRDFKLFEFEGDGTVTRT